jgi:hypothetical protein
MRRWLIRLSIAFAVLVGVLAFAGWRASKRFEPYIREQAIAYLQSRFGTGVELAKLHVSVRFLSPWKPRAARLVVSGEGLRLPPYIGVSNFSVHTSLGEIWDSPRRIGEIRLRGLEINLPPKDQRPRSTSPGSGVPAVFVDRIHSDEATLRIFPADPQKLPRAFEIHHLTLTGAAPGQPMKYDATLTNPAPRGNIHALGNFGPWQREDPGQTPITGEYTFRDADLHTFQSIAGILNSTGHYEGVLERIAVHGETRTPDFRLAGGNPVPLTTQFDSIVDGTSGDTFLEPVRATLGSSTMECRGRIVRPEGVQARSIVLRVVLPKGKIEDLVRLAVKNPKPFIAGEVALKTKLEILPTPGRGLDERLQLDGNFALQKAQFLGGSVQDKIDELSRKAQGRPKDEQINDVLSAMRGAFQLRDGEIRFAELVFRAPGADVSLKGNYGIDSEQIDLHGFLRLKAKLSQTQSGWKRIVLRPVDPFFSKDGAGTLLPIQVVGSRSAPQFGLDKRKKGDESADRSK